MRAETVAALATILYPLIVQGYRFEPVCRWRPRQARVVIDGS